MPRLLVLGYGNTLRGDDGAGPALAEEVATWGLPGVRALAVQQLLPELAGDLAAVDAVLFVDAALAGGNSEPFTVRALRPQPSSRGITHYGNPSELLALAQGLHGPAPEAWLLTLPATDL